MSLTSANSGDEIFNRVIVEGTGPDGAQMQVTRWSGELANAILVPVATPALTNPSFDVNVTGWTMTGPSTFTRDTGAGLFDSAPASGQLSCGAGATTLETTLTGTFLRGLTYRLTWKMQSNNPYLQVGRARLGVLGTDERSVSLDFPSALTFYPYSISWTPQADYTGVKFHCDVQTASDTLWLDTFMLYRSLTTLVDRRGFVRTKILPVSSSITTTSGTRIGDLYLAAHKTTPFKGGFQVVGTGGVRTVKGGQEVHPAHLQPGQLVRLAHRIDPDTGAWGRDGRIAAVAYNHDSLTSTVTLDENRAGLEALLSRLAVVQGQRRT